MRASVSAFAAAALALVSAPALAQDVAKGADAFQEHCSQCHVLTGVGQGPSLLGVVGRKAASLPGYPYSDGLKASGLVWTPANLERFISGPTKLAPGTSMRVIVSDAGERRDLVAYLASLKR